MLTVTDKAAEYLRESLTRKETGAPEALRIVQTEDGYQLTLDNPKDDDQGIRAGGTELPASRLRGRRGAVRRHAGRLRIAPGAEPHADRRR